MLWTKKKLSLKFQFYPQELIFSLKFSLLVAMTTNQTERLEPK